MPFGHLHFLLWKGCLNPGHPSLGCREEEERNQLFRESAPCQPACSTGSLSGPPTGDCFCLEGQAGWGRGARVFLFNFLIPLAPRFCPFDTLDLPVVKPPPTPPRHGGELTACGHTPSFLSLFLLPSISTLVFFSCGPLGCTLEFAPGSSQMHHDNSSAICSKAPLCPEPKVHVLMFPIPDSF